MNPRLRFALVAASLSSLACATAQHPREESGGSAQTRAQPAPALSSDDAAALHHLLKLFDADGPLHPRMEERVAFYLERLRKKDLAELERRRLLVWPAMSRELKAAKLPEALSAMAYVESHFDPSVRGGNACAGLWQFTAPTALKQGLRIEGEVDERLDPEKSSRAAAHYLRALMDELGADSFLLAIAGYNAGETAVRAALKQSVAAGGEAPRDFWTLEKRGLLSNETASYVPQVLAAAIALLPPDAR